MSKELKRMQELAGVAVNEEDTNDPVAVYLRNLQKDIMDLALVTDRFYKAWTDDPTPGSLTRFDKQEGGRIERQPSWKVAMGRFSGKDMYNYLLFKVSEMSNGLDLDKGNLDKYLDGVLDEILRLTKGDFNKEALIKEFPNSSNYIGQLGSGNVQKDKDILARLLTVDNSFLTSGGYGAVGKLKSDKELYKDFKDGTLFSSSFGNLSTVSEEKNKINKMNNEFKRMQELAGVKLQENYELEEAAAENLELKKLQKQAYSALKGMGFDSKITSGEAGAGKTILSKQTYKDNRGVALVNLDPKTGIFDVLITSDSLKRDKDNKNQNLDPDQEANKVVDELEKLIDRNKFEVGYKQTNDRGGSIYQIFVRAKSTGKKGGVMATEALNEVYVAGGIVGVGAINNPFEGRKKESYEDAFEHFLGEKYALKEEEEKEVKEGEEVELKENAGTSIDNFINSFDFSQKGNDELIDFAHRLLNRNVSSGEFEKLKSYFGNDLEFFNFVSDPSKGVKAIAQQIYQKLKQGVGNTGKIETWATDPMALQSLLDKLK